MNPAVWGPHAWAFLHALAESFPDNPTQAQKDSAIQFLHHLAEVLPCESCRGHFASLLASFPPSVQTGNDFRRWANEAHNIVNRRLHKPEIAFENRLQSLNMHAAASAANVNVANAAANVNVANAAANVNVANAAANVNVPDCDCNLGATTTTAKTESPDLLRIAFVIVVCAVVFLFATSFFRGNSVINGSGSSSGSSSRGSNTSSSDAQLRGFELRVS
jgi:hypothetical protein